MNDTSKQDAILMQQSLRIAGKAREDRTVVLKAQTQADALNIATLVDAFGPMTQSEISAAIEEMKGRRLSATRMQNAMKALKTTRILNSKDHGVFIYDYSDRRWMLTTDATRIAKSLSVRFSAFLTEMENTVARLANLMDSIEPGKGRLIRSDSVKAMAGLTVAVTEVMKELDLVMTGMISEEQWTRKGLRSAVASVRDIETRILATGASIT